MAIEVRKVENARERHIFLTFPWKLYRHDPLWVPPLMTDRKKSIDPDQGVFFQRGVAEFFIAWDGSKAVGTICAAEDIEGNRATGRKDCVFGFFECHNDYAIACALLDRAAGWAMSRDLNALYGPFNLDYEDAYGILVEGRDRPPVMLCGHTPDYYQEFVERYGFSAARGDNIAYEIDLHKNSKQLEKLEEMAVRVKQRRNFVIRPADFSRWQDEIDNVLALINPALEHLPGHIPWRREALEKLLVPFLDIADPELILFAEEDGSPVGFFPCVPNMNEVLIHANGLRYPWNYLQAFYYSKKKVQCGSIKSVLVLPEYWGSGIVILLFSEMVSKLKEKGYRWVDLSLTSDDNPKTPELAERMGGRIYKRYRVYRYFLE
ncbi:MAG: GNAT family N-acetyltransferase [Chloroflexi bacterium]|nr:GNAT family N-acetyltransferase [Chloroflexota bacterium]